jgi:hypothetical protein
MDTCIADDKDNKALRHSCSPRASKIPKLPEVAARQAKYWIYLLLIADKVFLYRTPTSRV